MPGAGWALDHVPAMLGADDDPTGFRPELHPLVAEAARRRPHVRFGASHRVWEALVPAIIEQKVTGQEAFGGFRRLVHRYGERAPGPGRDLELWVQPSAETIRRIPSWEWLRAAHRPRPLPHARPRGDGRRHPRPPHAARKPTRSCAPCPASGSGPPPRSASRAFGDPDAVSFGDYHVAKDVGWAVTGDAVRRRRAARVPRALATAAQPCGAPSSTASPEVARDAVRGWPRARTCPPADRPSRR